MSDYRHGNPVLHIEHLGRCSIEGFGPEISPAGAIHQPDDNPEAVSNALHAAGEVIVPVDTGYFALHGLTHQIATISQHREETGRDVLVRVLPNLYDVRTKHAREILGELRRKFADLVFKTHINFNAKLREASEAHTKKIAS